MLVPEIHSNLHILLLHLPRDGGWIQPTPDLFKTKLDIFWGLPGRHKQRRVWFD